MITRVRAINPGERWRVSLATKATADGRWLAYPIQSMVTALPGRRHIVHQTQQDAICYALARHEGYSHQAAMNKVRRTAARR